jgi:hypothetical protein
MENMEVVINSKKEIEMKRTVILIFLSIFLFSIFAFADDNATNGEGTPLGHGAVGRGYYHGTEYMYKVSLYVGITENAYYTDESLHRFQMVGTEPLYLKPNYLVVPDGTIFATKNKVQYLQGATLQTTRTVSRKAITNLPAPPIVCGGNIQAVKTFFGDTVTLTNLIKETAIKQGLTPAQLVENMTFTIDGNTGKFPASDILPVKVNGSYQNKVPWLVVYEPIVFAHLRDGKTTLAFTATEYAMAQKAGYFNFFNGEPDGQYI